MTMACFQENIQSFLENTPIGTERRRGDDRNSMACFLEKIKSFLEHTPIGTERRRGEDRNDNGMFSRKLKIFSRKHADRDGEAERRGQILPWHAF